MTNPEGFEPTLTDHLRRIFDDVEAEYDAFDLSDLPADVPQGAFDKVESLMKEYGFKDEVVAKKAAIKWWGDYLERRSGR